MDMRTHDHALTGRGGVEGLRALLYGREQRNRLRRQLGDMLLPGSSVVRCELERAKFKPGRKLTGYYVVGVDSGHGRARRAIEVSWHAAPAPDDLGVDVMAMQEEARRGDLAVPFATLRTRSSETGAVVQVSPLDVAYPQLVRLSRPDHVRELLASVEGRGAMRAASHYAVATLRYRPRQRHVLRYDPDGVAGPGSVFAKLYRDGGAAAAFAVADDIADRLDRSGAPVAAARPLGAWGPDDVVLYPRLSGTPMSRRLWDSAPAPLRHLTTAGVLLRTLHDGGAGTLQPHLRRHDLEAELRSVARAAEHLAPLLPATMTQVSDVLAAARAAAAAVPAEPSGLAHGDYKADHLWVDRDRLTLLDFDTCCLAEPALDIGKFLADLAWWYLAADRPGLRQTQDLFLQGYGDISPQRLARARVYEAVVLTKLTIRRLRRFEPDWGLRTAALVETAARLLRPVVPTQPRTASRTRTG